VYNILGYETLNKSTTPNKYKGVIDERNTERCQNVNDLFNDDFTIKDIQYNEDGFIDYNQLDYLNVGSSEQYFVKDTINAKGVIRINDDEIQVYDSEENTPGNYLYNVGVYMN
jgi:hypothetical protein